MKYKTLKPGDVLQEGDEFEHDGKMHNIFPEGVGTTVSGVGEYYRPIIEVCDHVYGVGIEDCAGIDLLTPLSKEHKKDFEEGAFNSIWFKHCPDCGVKL